MAAAPVAELREIARCAMWALAAREMLRVLGLWTQTVLPPVVTGVIFLAIFGGALSGRLPAVASVPYVRFILPGLLVMTVAGQAFANNSTSLFQAKNEGYIEDVLTSPLALLGGVFYAADRLDQPWRTLTQADPLYYLVDATRQGWAGVHEASVAVALLVALAVAAAVFAVVVALVERGWRLKP